jgi:restriction endonuclease S subunit
MVDFEGVCSNVTFTLQANEEKLSQKLLPFIIQTESFTKHACNSAHGSTNPFLNWKDIASYDLLLPPLNEQKKIAEVLWTVEENMKSSENYLNFNQKMMNKLMIELFTNGANNKKFKLIHLGDECKNIQYGYTASADTSQVGPKFLRITDISSGKVDWDKVPYCKCSDKDIEDNLLKKGDIVFARTGASTGASYLFDDSIKAVFASYLIRMQLTDNLLPKFVAYYFKSKLYWDQVASNIAGSAQGGINSKVLSSLTIPFPSKEEQNKIIKILDKTDKQINSIKNNLNSLKALRQKLTNELLIGKLRL